MGDWTKSILRAQRNGKKNILIKDIPVIFSRDKYM